MYVSSLRNTRGKTAPALVFTDGRRDAPVPHLCVYIYLYVYNALTCWVCSIQMFRLFVAVAGLLLFPLPVLLLLPLLLLIPLSFCVSVNLVRRLV